MFWHIILYNLKYYISYPLALVSTGLRRIVPIIIIILLWSNLEDQSDSISFNNLVSYFLIVSGFAEILMINRLHLAKRIGKSIKEGSISQSLIKPYNTIKLLYFDTIGGGFDKYIFGFVLVVIGIANLSQTSLTFLNIIYGILLFLIAIGIAFGINLLVGTVAIYAEDTFLQQYVAQETIRIFSGALVPLIFFPDVLESILRLSPFPYLGFYPAAVIEGTQLFDINLLTIGILWLIAINTIAIIFWSFSIKKYEAIGI